MGERIMMPAGSSVTKGAPPPRVEAKQSDRAKLRARFASPVVKDVEIDVTPELAAQILEHCNQKNRHIAARRVEQYAHEMREGRWKITNQSLGFGHDGTLYDGQHRLSAVIAAGITVRLRFTLGLEEESRKAIDKGAVRGIGDELRMLFGMKNGPALVSLMRGVALVLNEPKPASVDEALRWYERFEVELDWCVEHFYRPGAQRSTHLRTSASVACAIVFAHKTNPEKIREFALKVRDGLGLTATEPAYVLRVSIDYHSTHKVPPRAHAVRTLRAAMAHVLGETIKKVYDTDDAVIFFARAHGIEFVKGENTSGATQAEKYAKSKAGGGEG